MKKITRLLVFMMLATLSSCNHKENEKNSDRTTLVPNPEEQKKDSPANHAKEDVCNFEDILVDPKTPKLAIALYHNTAKLSEEPLAYFENLKSTNPKERAFYFRVLTNSYAKADGAYSEGLGNLGKEYIEYETQDFASYFDNQNCFTDNDLKTWAKIVVSEFEIIDENIKSGKGEPLAYVYCRKLIQHSKRLPDNQQKTIKKFTELLKNEWSEYLKNM